MTDSPEHVFLDQPDQPIEPVKPKPKKTKKPKSVKPVVQQPLVSKTLRYQVQTDLWDSSICKYYKQGDIIERQDSAAAPPHCKQL